MQGFNISTIITSRVDLGKCVLVYSSCCGEDEMTKYIQTHEKFEQNLVQSKHLALLALTSDIVIEVLN